MSGESTQKRYGKLSDDQIKRLIGILPEIRASMQEELSELLRSPPSGKLQTVVENGIYWAAFYEMPFARHVAYGLYVLGQKDKLQEIANADDPQEEMLRWIEEGEMEGDPTEGRLRFI